MSGPPPAGPCVCVSVVLITSPNHLGPLPIPLPCTPFCINSCARATRQTQTASASLVSAHVKGDAFESRAELLGTIPVPIMSKPGVLRLRNGRLTFTADDGEVKLDAPTHELHSAAVSASGIHVWHGPSRMRFAFGRGQG